MIVQRIRNIVRITAGCLVLLFGISWVYEWSTLFYDYHFTSRIFVIRLPDYLLVTQLLCGLLFIIMSGFIFRKRIRPRAGLLAVLIVFLITWLIVWQMLR